jgi:hypothetical protein
LTGNLTQELRFDPVKPVGFKTGMVRLKPDTTNGFETGCNR